MILFASDAEKGDAPSQPNAAPSSGRSKRTLAKKKLIASDDDESDFDAQDESDDDEFAPPAKKKPKAAQSTKTSRLPVKKGPVSKQAKLYF